MESEQSSQQNVQPKRLKKNQKNSSLTGNRNSPLFTLCLSTIRELRRAMLNKDDMQRRIDALY